jgi:hypothetical protein
MTLAKKYRATHPNVAWKYCVAEAEKLCKLSKITNPQEHIFKSLNFIIYNY